MRTHGKLPGTVRRIILTGFMGAGKSTVGALLAQRLGWQFVDTDQVIEAQTGLTIARLFAEHGEATFRALEAEAVRDKVQANDVVLALGGGAIEVEGTREALLKLREACVVFLDAPLEVMVERCLAQPGAAERPVLRDRERLTTRLAARLPHYRRAHLIVATANLTPEAVAEEIFAVLRDSMPGHAAVQDLRKENLTQR
jgi:shikimate kinase